MQELKRVLPKFLLSIPFLYTLYAALRFSSQSSVLFIETEKKGGVEGGIRQLSVRNTSFYNFEEAPSMPYSQPETLAAITN